MRHYERHAPDPSCQEIHCYSHHVDERRHAPPSVVCSSCHHAFPTGEHLLADYELRLAEMAMTGGQAGAGAEPPQDPAMVTMCPHCLRDL